MIKHQFGGYSTFVERYDWYTGDDYQSRYITVKPGQKVYGALQLQPNGRDYEMIAGVVNATHSSQHVSHVIQTDPKAGVSSIAWIVLEHQPFVCGQMPSSGSIVFDNIEANWVGNHHCAVHRARASAGMQLQHHDSVANGSANELEYSITTQPNEAGVFNHSSLRSLKPLLRPMRTATTPSSQQTTVIECLINVRKPAIFTSQCG
jgi:hypothetical protein